MAQRQSAPPLCLHDSRGSNARRGVQGVRRCIALTLASRCSSGRPNDLRATRSERQSSLVGPRTHTDAAAGEVSWSFASADGTGGPPPLRSGTDQQ